MSKYSDPTPKQINFLVEAGKQFAMSNDFTKDKDSIPDRMFEFVCNKILESDDTEIKIDLSRFLMFRGYAEFISVSNKAMMMALMKH